MGRDRTLINLPFVIGGSVIGPSHLRKNLPCQDACAYKVSQNKVIVAVADGLGSASKSNEGATFVVKEIVDSLEKEEKLNKRNLKKYIGLSREKLKRKAIECGGKFEDFASTLIVVVVERRKVIVAHIGDGAVVGQTKNGLEVLSYPEESEYINEVIPLTYENWERHLRFSIYNKKFECIAVMTDGCHRAAFKKEKDTLIPFEGFFNPIFSYSKKIKDPKEGTEEIIKLLSSKKINEYMEDDKTLLIIVLEPDYSIK
ncbi:MAG: PP2C family serine/threonine-protein phosphatase [candidate division WOR-3 bacterium]